MRVLVLFVRHGTNKYQDALINLDQIYQHQAPGLTRSTFVIDNALSDGVVEKLDKDAVLIGGDNTQWEFSGWQHAIDMLRNEIGGYDAIHFVTSAFQTLHTSYLERFSTRMIEVVARRPIVAGHIDYYPHPIRFDMHVSRHWIRSSFWLINPAELLRLRKLVTIDRHSDLFSDLTDWPFAADAPLSRGYQELIHGWLTSDHGTGQGTTWHSRFDLNEETRMLFREKSVAIMNEHLLSVRLRAQGTHLLDLTYLAEVTERGESLPKRFPGWRRQIELRRVAGHARIDDPIWR